MSDLMHGDSRVEQSRSPGDSEPPSPKPHWWCRRDGRSAQVPATRMVCHAEDLYMAVKTPDFGSLTLTRGSGGDRERVRAGGCIAPQNSDKEED